MAGPVAHIFCALALFSHESDSFKKPFIIGTSLPDIRYLGVIEREKTHTQTVITIHDVLNSKTPFKAGFLFHSLVDQRREEFYEKNGLYDSLENFQGRSQLMKIYEDIYLYDKLENMPTILSYFDHVMYDEIYLQLEYKHLASWHSILQHYLVKKQNLQSLEDLMYSEKIQFYLPYYAFYWPHFVTRLFIEQFIFKIQRHLIYLENHELFNRLLKEFYNNAKEYLNY